MGDRTPIPAEVYDYLNALFGKQFLNSYGTAPEFQATVRWLRDAVRVEPAWEPDPEAVKADHAARDVGNEEDSEVALRRLHAAGWHLRKDDP